MKNRANIIREFRQGSDVRGDMAEQASSSHARDLTVGVAEIIGIEAQEEQLGQQLSKDGFRQLCLKCGDPISRERLKAKPYAIRCRDCQEEYESENGIGFKPGRRW